MAVFAIGDLHLSLGGDKSMEYFSGWNNYVGRIEKNWRERVGEKDTVVLLGDTSWAMRHEELKPDFAFIESLPGTKVIIKGNHDYWWTTKTKMNAFIEGEGFNSIKILHNDCYIADNLALCGTRSWMIEESEPHDQKLTQREAGRLEASLKAAEKSGKEPVVFLHYPPLFLDGMSGNMVELMLKYKVKRCYYAHLHAGACKLAFSGVYMGIDFQLVSSDHLKFAPKLVEC